MRKKEELEKIERKPIDWFSSGQHSVPLNIDLHIKVDFYLSWNTERNRRASRPSWAPLSASIPWFCDAPQRHPIHPPARRCHSVRAALGRAGEGRRIPKSFVIWPGTCVWCFGVELWCLPPRPCSPVGLSWLGGSIPGLAIQIELCADEVRISSVLEVLSRHLNQNTLKNYPW